MMFRGLMIYILYIYIYVYESPPLCAYTVHGFTRVHQLYNPLSSLDNWLMDSMTKTSPPCESTSLREVESLRSGGSLLILYI